MTCVDTRGGPCPRMLVVSAVEVVRWLPGGGGGDCIPFCHKRRNGYGMWMPRLCSDGALGRCMCAKRRGVACNDAGVTQREAPPRDAPPPDAAMHSP